MEKEKPGTGLEGQERAITPGEEAPLEGCDVGPPRGKGKAFPSRSSGRIVKAVLIAVVLLAVCTAILTASKAYGVWVISGIAVILFALGLLKKDRPPEGGGPGQGQGGDRQTP